MDQAQVSSRYGTILFFLAGIFLLATAFLNVSITSSEVKHSRLEEWYRETGSMLGKWRAARARSAAFFSAISLDILSAKWLIATGEKIPFPDGSTSSFTLRDRTLPRFYFLEIGFNPPGDWFWLGGSIGELAADPIFRDLQGGANIFGRDLEAIDRRTMASEAKIKLMHTALKNAFKSKDARAILADDLSRVLVSREHTEKVALCWITSGSWSCRGRTLTLGHPASYLNRFDRHDWVKREAHIKHHLYDELSAARTSEEIEMSLSALWQQAHQSLLDFSVTPTQLSLPGTGLTLTVNELLLFAGPLLVLFQFMFLITKERIAGSEDNAAVVFPQFSSPDDPLKPFAAVGIADLGQRFIWLSFLAAPLLILTLGVLARYDLTPVHNQFGILAIHSIVARREADLFSVTLDIVNLFCLGASVVIMIRLTTLHSAPPKYFVGVVRRFLLRGGVMGIGVALSLIGWGLFGARGSEWKPFLAAVTIIWIMGVCLAIVRGSRTAALLSTIGLGFALTASVVS